MACCRVLLPLKARRNRQGLIPSDVRPHGRGRCRRLVREARHPHQVACSRSRPDAELGGTAGARKRPLPGIDPAHLSPIAHCHSIVTPEASAFTSLRQGRCRSRARGQARLRMIAKLPVPHRTSRSSRQLPVPLIAIATAPPTSAMMNRSLAPGQVMAAKYRVEISRASARLRRVPHSAGRAATRRGEQRRDGRQDRTQSLHKTAAS